MTDQYVPQLRQRFLEDMLIKRLQPKTQTMYLRAMRDFTRFLGHAPDSATLEELRAFQLDMKERGVGAPTFNKFVQNAPNGPLISLRSRQIIGILFVSNFVRPN